MPDFKAKMHQIRFGLGLRPRPRWGSLQRSPDPLAGVLLLRGGRGRVRWEGEGRGKEGKGGEQGRREGEGRPPNVRDALTPLDKSFDLASLNISKFDMFKEAIRLNGSAPLKLQPYCAAEMRLSLLTAKHIDSAVLCFYSKTGFWPSYCQFSTDLDKILHTAICAHGVHLWADLDRDRRMGGSMPNQNDYVFVIFRLILSCNAP